MRMSEEAIARERFESIVNRAQCRAQEAVEEKILTTRGLANMAAANRPYVADWPNVFVEGFEEVSTNLREIFKGPKLPCVPLSFHPEVKSKLRLKILPMSFIENESFQPIQKIWELVVLEEESSRLETQRDRLSIPWRHKRNGLFQPEQDSRPSATA